MGRGNGPAMVRDIQFLGIRLRAMAQSTELEDRVLAAMMLASGTETVSVSKAEGHFGTPITLFEADLRKNSDMRRFLGLMEKSGILGRLSHDADARTDEQCAFHFRLDKQKAYLGELALADGRDAIDVRLKVAVYPAKRGAAVKLISEWLSQFSEK